MARIVLADDGIEFDGKTPDERPLGGVESSVVALMQELAALGHDVHVLNKSKAPLDHRGVKWRPIDGGDWPDAVDLYIANRGDKLLDRMPGAKRTVFWTHNPAQYLLKWRYLIKLWRIKPAIIFIGDYHATTYPGWAPGGDRVVIPYGLPDAFCQAEPLNTPPPPRAVFTSNPLRSLDWLLDVWVEEIEPRVPGAELHVFAGAATYGSVGEAKASAMQAVLDRAKALEGQGVRLRGPVPKAVLVEELHAARVMLYRGDLNETFCLAVGEAQAMGVPAVVENLGSVRERVIDGETGFVCAGRGAFAENARNLLSDDGLWTSQHLAALDKQRSWRWPQAAAAFEALIP
ncbi:MAG: glycosyltransferase family 4 protein [Rhodospirillales bacterium]|nr:glycosyltransferase family 4 protein [Alphaproteobacteria bacterium]MBL6947244.1 glycosyltransferase family 4 protein [Rhodospirillales bacterium]